ncbi:hypothetical protein QR680_006081 [Steinernema hermaphroditum]|uniref:Uncharacterized protein n=1 Tax=Steinernema hermaphroditum TaxID=289476 RepID=A0AA39HUB0_9BILA|nr:hypothetical protein QR680_006081 [Steinernema hermaphroditum]
MKRNVMSMRFWLLLSLLICYAVANSSPDSLSRKRVKHRNVNYNNPLTIGLICGIVAYWAVAVPTLIVLYLKCCDPRKIRDIDMNNRYSHRFGLTILETSEEVGDAMQEVPEETSPKFEATMQRMRQAVAVAGYRKTSTFAEVPSPSDKRLVMVVSHYLK